MSELIGCAAGVLPQEEEFQLMQMRIWNADERLDELQTNIKTQVLRYVGR